MRLAKAASARYTRAASDRPPGTPSVKGSRRSRQLSQTAFSVLSGVRLARPLIVTVSGRVDLQILSGNLLNSCSCC